MTIPNNPAEIENLKKIAELNREAGDWQYSPKPTDPSDSKLVIEDALKRVGNAKLPPKK